MNIEVDPSDVELFQIIWNLFFDVILHQIQLCFSNKFLNISWKITSAAWDVSPISVASQWRLPLIVLIICIEKILCRGVTMHLPIAFPALADSNCNVPYPS